MSGTPRKELAPLTRKRHSPDDPLSPRSRVSHPCKLFIRNKSDGCDGVDGFFNGICLHAYLRP